MKIYILYIYISRISIYMIRERLSRFARSPIIILGVRIRIMPRARYWKNSMNNHVILKGVDVEVMKVIQLASEVHN